MASKSTYAADEKGAEVEATLDELDKLLDRVKVLYEQYFMGIQKQAPAHMHSDCERRIRELQQQQIRNTALRYRFATLQQKFGAYNTYWKRSLREIESGRYLRNLAKVRRQAAATGEEIPDEIVAKMPKRMREAIERDREAALAKAKREGRLHEVAPAIAEFEDDAKTLPEVPRFAAPPAPGKPAAGRDPFAKDSLSAMADEALAAVERHEHVEVAPPPAKPSMPPPSSRPSMPPPPSRPSMPPPPSRPSMTPPPSRVVPPPLPPRAAPPPPSKVVPPSLPPRAAPPPPPPPSSRAAPSSPIPGMSETDTRTLYAKYIKARDVVGDRSDPMSYDKLVRTLSAQAPRIIEQHKASGVEFNVVIKDNKVVLKAKPK